LKFNIILEPEEDGGFSVTVPELDGCFTQGETEEEEAIICYLEGLEKVKKRRKEILKMLGKPLKNVRKD
jgi:predicted RNase H-like HicB family nuclease